MLFGATRAERCGLATARDRVDEHRRNRHQPASDEGGSPQAAHGKPRQLPTAMRHFTGRQEELAELDFLLDQALDAGTVLVVAISGTAGIGKTTLAVSWAHRVAHRFPDGQMYINLRGFEANAPAMDPAEAVRRFLNALNVPPEHRHDWAVACCAAVAAADWLADPAIQAWAHRTLARSYTRLGRFDDADTQLRDALRLYHESADQAGQADTHYHLGILWSRRNRLACALDHARRSLDLSRAAGHQRGQALALNAVGFCQALLGNYQSSLISCEQALVLHQELSDQHGQAHTWDSLGYAHHHLGHHVQAVNCYQNALTMVRNLGDRYQEADTLANTYLAMGRPHAAHGDWQQALTILDELNHPEAEQIRAKLATLSTA